jgi:two-component system, sensor histidine kinase and response regulator
LNQPESIPDRSWSAVRLLKGWITRARRSSRRRTGGLWVSIGLILLSALPIAMRLEPSELTVALPLVVTAIIFQLQPALSTYRLAITATLAYLLPLALWWGDHGVWLRLPLYAFFVACVWALGWAHRRSVRDYLRRLRSRQRLAGRIRSQSSRLAATQDELSEAIRHRQQAQRAMLDTRVQQLGLLELLPAHVFHKDLQGRFSFASRSFCELLGRPAAEIIGKTDFDFYLPELARKYRHDDADILAAGVARDEIEQYRTAAGQLRYMQVRKAPLRDSQQRIIGLQGMFWDVTANHHSELELRRSEARKRALLHAALDGILLVDADGRIVEMNPAAEGMFGVSGNYGGSFDQLGDLMAVAGRAPVESRAGGASSVQPASDERRQRPRVSPGTVVPPAEQLVGEGLESLLRRATGRRVEVRLRRHNGSWFDGEISAQPVPFDQQTGWAIFVRDVTRRKRNEAELRAAKEAAESASQAKSQFVANVSHELRTPLTGILGLAELLLNSPLDLQQRKYVDMLTQSATGLHALIDDLLDFSKIEAQQMDIQPSLVDWVQVHEASTAALAPRAQLRGLEVVLDLSPDLPASVSIDGQRLGQVLTNLIGNAIKFTHHGEIIVRSRVIQVQDEVCHLRTEILDTGIGLPPEKLQEVFEAFRQADSSRNRRYGGTGLGLAISRALIQRMGGDLSASNRPDGGSCFQIDLYIKRESASAVAATEPLAVAVAVPHRATSEALQRWLGAVGHHARRIDPHAELERQLGEWMEQWPADAPAAVLLDCRTADWQQLRLERPRLRWVLLHPLSSPPPSLPVWWPADQTSFVSLPCFHAALRQALVGQAGESDGRPGAAAESLGAGPAKQQLSRRILLVDDSPINRQIIAAMLQQLGHRVEQAGGGQEAIDLCIQQPFECVLMDLQMPGLDGFETTQRLRQRFPLGSLPAGSEAVAAGELGAGGGHLPILALSANVLPEDQQRCMAAGMDAFLTKPVTKRQLQEAIDRLFPVASSQSTGGGASAVASGAELGGKTPEEPPPAEPQPLDEGPDLVALQQLVGGDAEALQQLIDAFLIEGPALQEQCRGALDAGQASGAARAAHTLKANLRYFGCNAASRLAYAVERAARQQQLVTAEQALVALNPALDRLWTRLRTPANSHCLADPVPPTSPPT